MTYRLLLLLRCWFVINRSERTFFEPIPTNVAFFFSAFSSHLHLYQFALSSLSMIFFLLYSSPGLSSRLWCFRLSCAQFMCYWCSFDCCISYFLLLSFGARYFFCIFCHLISHLHPVNISWFCWLSKKFMCSSAMIFAHCSISLSCSFYIFVLIVRLEVSEYFFSIYSFHLISFDAHFIYTANSLYFYCFCVLLEQIIWDNGEE